MNDRVAKGCLISFNVIFLIAGLLMIIGGALLEFTEQGKNILLTLNPVATSSQLGAIGVALIAIGALVAFVALLGCCGSAYESRCLLLLYFGSVLFLLLCQIGIAVAAFVMGTSGFSEVINNQLKNYVNRYEEENESLENAVMDSVQQFFKCCGYDGPEDYRPDSTNPPIVTVTSSNVTTTATTVQTTTEITAQSRTTFQPNVTFQLTTTATYLTGNWPKSCCKPDGNITVCQNDALPLSELKNYLYTQGCTELIEQWVIENLYIIGGVGVAIAVIELVSMIIACNLRKSLD